MFTSKTISSRVMATLKKRLADAEAEFKAESKRIDDEAKAETKRIEEESKSKINMVHAEAWTSKEVLADSLVAKLLGS